MKRLLSAALCAAWFAFYASVWMGCVFFTPPPRPEAVRYCHNPAAHRFEPCDNFIEILNV